MQSECNVFRLLRVIRSRCEEITSSKLEDANTVGLINILFRILIDYDDKKKHQITMVDSHIIIFMQKQQVHAKTYPNMKTDTRT